MATVWDSLEDSKSPQNLLPRRDLVWLQHSAGSRRQIMGEKRAVHRRRVLKAGTIEFGGGVIDCTVRNLSKNLCGSRCSDASRHPRDVHLDDTERRVALRLSCDLSERATDSVRFN